MNSTIKKPFKNATITVNVKLSKGFRFRVFVAIKLIWIASLVLGCGINIVKSET